MPKDRRGGRFAAIFADPWVLGDLVTTCLGASAGLCWCFAARAWMARDFVRALVLTGLGIGLSALIPASDEWFFRLGAARLHRMRS